ncbi:MAG: 4Fe-4S binding protein [Deltaproteobacteria bacterium]|nr:4Fe-4S binding protein [Deltaproteobacteria bacterium]
MTTPSCPPRHVEREFLLAFWKLRIRRSRSGGSQGFDLLRVGPVRRLVEWKGFPYVFQAMLLAGFLVLLLVGWGRRTPPGVNAKLFAKTNVVTLLVWGLWWPSMIWVAVLFGRAWCMVCPLELVSNVSERLARAAGVRQRPLPRRLAAGGLIVALYAAIQLLVAGAHINRIPAYTALFLLALLGIAAVTGLLLRDRAFCRGFCPVGQLLATYGRGGMLAVRAGSSEACGACTGKGCLLSCNRTRLDARSCPSLLNPPRLNSNRECLVCGQCLKACAPDNMQLLLRRPFPKEDAREREASWPTTLFVMLVSGFVTWELLAEWPRAEDVFLSIPRWLANGLGVPSLSGFLVGVWALAFVPLALWTLAFAAARMAGSTGSIGTTWRRLALPVAVVVSAGHMAKGLAKVVSWGPFLPGALHDPTGVATAIALSTRASSQPPALTPLPVVAAVGAILILAGTFLAAREARLSETEGRVDRRLLAPKLALAAAYLGVMVGWSLQ